MLALPELIVAMFSFLLNFPWEMLQVKLYSGMAGARHWDAMVFCTRASLGDVGISVVSFWMVALVDYRGRR